MPPKKEPLRLLAVSSSPKLAESLRGFLPAAQFSPIHTAAAAGEAKRRLIDAEYDILVINTPLADDFGVQLALDVSAQYSTGILLLVKSELYEQVAYQVEDSGILTLARPATRQSVYTALKMLTAMHARLKAVERETISLKSKMAEIRIVNRAKCVLIEHLKMSEPEAHRYIEKQAMDRCVRRREIAENIIRTYS